MFQEFKERGVFVACMNSTFISFIPKKSGAIDIRGFRSISLVESIYKLISKVLGSKLKKSLGKLVGPIKALLFKGDEFPLRLLLLMRWWMAKSRSGGTG